MAYKELSGFDIGVVTEGDDVHYPYPVNPTDLDEKVPLPPTNPGVMAANGRLPSTPGHVCAFGGRLGVGSLEHVGLIVHNDRKIEVTPADQQAVYSDRVRGTGAIVLANEAVVIPHTVIVGAWEAEKLADSNARVSLYGNTGLFIAQFFPLAFHIEDRDVSSHTYEAVAARSTW